MTAISKAQVTQNLQMKNELDTQVFLGGVTEKIS
jgi:hypothetical protein